MRFHYLQRREIRVGGQNEFCVRRGTAVGEDSMRSKAVFSVK